MVKFRKKKGQILGSPAHVLPPAASFHRYAQGFLECTISAGKLRCLMNTFFQIRKTQCILLCTATTFLIYIFLLSGEVTETFNFCKTSCTRDFVIDCIHRTALFGSGPMAGYELHVILHAQTQHLPLDIATVVSGQIVFQSGTGTAAAFIC